MARRPRDPLLPRPAADLVPDPDQGTGRGAPALGRPAHARVPDEGRLHARPRRRRRSRSSYNAHKDAYCRIFDRCGLQLCRRAVGSRHDGGLRLARVHGPERGRRGRRRPLRRRAATRPTSSWPAACPRRPAAPAGEREEVATPGVAHHRGGVGIPRDRSAPSPSSRSSSSGPTRPVLALVRGDHALHERKLARALRREARPARPEEVAAAPGRRARLGRARSARAGDAILADESLARGRATWSGPTATGTTSRRWRRDRFRVRASPICRWRWPGRAVRQCGKPLRIERVIEIGNIFKLGTKYSDAARRHVPRRARPAAADRHGHRMGSAPPGSPPRRSSSATTRTASSGPGRLRPSRCTWSGRGQGQRAVRAPARRSTASFDRRASTCCWTIATSAPA